MSKIIHTGRVLANAPRAVQIREPEGDPKHPHSAVHGSINILVNSRTEANQLMDNWDKIAEALSLKINEILDLIPKDSFVGLKGNHPLSDDNN